jgi:hypothetical protein
MVTEFVTSCLINAIGVFTPPLHIGQYSRYVEPMIVEGPVVADVLVSRANCLHRYCKRHVFMKASFDTYI